MMSDSLIINTYLLWGATWCTQFQWRGNLLFWGRLRYEFGSVLHTVGNTAWSHLSFLIISHSLESFLHLCVEKISINKTNDIDMGTEMK